MAGKPKVARNNGFSVDLGGADSTWISVSELTSDIDPSVSETVGKDAKHLVQVVPGERKTNDLTLTRYATDDHLLSDWYKKVGIDGDMTAEKHITIKLYDPENKPMAEVSIEGALPVSLKYSDFSAQNPELQTEEIMIVFTNWERVK
jgi:phage tail-like protein